MRIAVMMSTYNGEKYLSEQLESLSRQTVAENLTVYIRDDGSTDDTFSVIDVWSRRIPIVLYKGKNVGPAGSFWQLLMNPEIQADYYAFCDQDDIWDADKLERGILLLEKDIHLSLCNARLTDSAGGVIQEKLHDKVPELSVLSQFVCGMAQGCAMVFTRELRDYFLNNPINCVPMHDVIVALHALGLCRIVWDEEPRFCYRMHENNVVAKNGKSFLKRLKNTWWIWKNGSEHSMSKVAEEMLEKPLSLTEEERVFLNHMKNYKTSLRSKVFVIRNANTEGVPWPAVRSYYMRVILNLY